MLALHLLQNSMVYVSTLMLQRVLGEPIRLEHMRAKEHRALTPLFLGSREPPWHLPARHDRSSTT
jgi:hypothetical protein